MQEPLQTGGGQVVWRVTLESLTEAGSCTVESRHRNIIALGLDVALLKNVLKSAASNTVDHVEVKLANRSIPLAAGAHRQHPFLVFTIKGPSLNLVHELPTSHPFSGQEIDRILSLANSTALCEYYLDIQPVTSRIQALLEKLKSLGDDVTFATLACGDLHLHIAGLQGSVGVEFRQLQVVPPEKETAQLETSFSTPEKRFSTAQEDGSASFVTMQYKHFSRAIAASQSSRPLQLLCGIGPNNSYMHVMFGFEDRNGGPGLDESKILGFTIPVNEVEEFD